MSIKSRFTEDLISLCRNLGHTTGHRSYFLKGAGSMLEDALVRFTLDKLINNHGFKIIKVPDLIKPVVFVSMVSISATIKQPLLFQIV